MPYPRQTKHLVGGFQICVVLPSTKAYCILISLLLQLSCACQSWHYPANYAHAHALAAWHPDTLLQHHPQVSCLRWAKH